MILEDPDGAPYPDAVQRLVTHLDPEEERIEVSRLDLVAALEAMRPKVDDMRAVLRRHETLDLVVENSRWVARCVCGDTKPTSSYEVALEWHEGHVAAALVEPQP